METTEDCRGCKWAKDKWHDSCYCVYYGYIRSKPKKDCWGWEKDERSETDKKEE